MPPFDLWLQGTDDIAEWFLGPGHRVQGLAAAAGRRQRHGRRSATTRPARAGGWEPLAIQVIEVAGGRIVGHHNFLYPELFAAFGLPPHLDD